MRQGRSAPTTMRSCAALRAGGTSHVRTLTCPLTDPLHDGPAGPSRPKGRPRGLTSPARAAAGTRTTGSPCGRTGKVLDWANDPTAARLAVRTPGAPPAPGSARRSRRPGPQPCPPQDSAAGADPAVSPRAQVPARGVAARRGRCDAAQRRSGGLGRGCWARRSSSSSRSRVAATLLAHYRREGPMPPAATGPGVAGTRCPGQTACETPRAVGPLRGAAGAPCMEM